MSDRQVAVTVFRVPCSSVICHSSFVMRDRLSGTAPLLPKLFRQFQRMQIGEMFTTADQLLF
jgi:hypothetical protein